MNLSHNSLQYQLPEKYHLNLQFTFLRSTKIKETREIERTAWTSRKMLLYVSGQRYDVSTAIQLVPYVQGFRRHKFIFTDTGKVYVSVVYLIFSNIIFLYSLNRMKTFTRKKKIEREKKIDRSPRSFTKKRKIYLTYEPSRKEKSRHFSMCARWYLVVNDNQT